MTRWRQNLAVRMPSLASGRHDDRPQRSEQEPWCVMRLGLANQCLRKAFFDRGDDSFSQPGTLQLCLDLVYQAGGACGYTAPYLLE